MCIRDRGKRREGYLDQAHRQRKKTQCKAEVVEPERTLHTQCEIPATKPGGNPDARGGSACFAYTYTSPQARFFYHVTFPDDSVAEKGRERADAKSYSGIVFDKPVRGPRCESLDPLTLVGHNDLCMFVGQPNKQRGRSKQIRYANEHTHTSIINQSACF